MSKNFCKGGCGNLATHKDWCKIIWTSGKRFGVGCPIIQKKKGKAISRYRIEEAKLGKNPMQNPEICKKNHSPERNRKAAETIKNLGRLGLLPQQIESDDLREIRRIRNQKALQKLWKEGKHPLQSKSKEEREIINQKISRTLESLAEKGKHPSQLWTDEMKQRMAKKFSERITEMIKNGQSISPGWKKFPYKNIILRSSWERIMAKFLDIHNVKWEYETLIIPYCDTTRDKVASTIPDFYLPEYNAIIEVKGKHFDAVQTKDKMDAINAFGYNTFLIGYSHIKRIKKNDLTILKAIKNEKN